jgi:hypothetical protein
MRKQMRSTFRIPGTEDRIINGNAPRSGGAEMLPDMTPMIPNEPKKPLNRFNGFVAPI